MTNDQAGTCVWCDSVARMSVLIKQGRFSGVLAIMVVIVALNGCASKPPTAFEEGRPVFNPERYFAGHTHSWGVFETRSGNPSQILHTETDGQLQDGVLRFEQDLLFEGGKKQHRSWVIRQVDEHHFTATGTGIVGTARGVAYGNVFHLDFTLDAISGNPLGHVHMSQWMYLQADGVTMVNRDTITKAGVILTEITEQFHKDR